LRKQFFDVLTLEESLSGKENVHKAGVAFGKLLETKETEGGKFGMKQFFLELWKFLNQRK
jgi:hypothetical protein